MTHDINGSRADLSQPTSIPSESTPPLAEMYGTAGQSRAPKHLILTDRFGRLHRALRISVTDRCNIRCQYCMPEVAQFMDSEHLLSFEQIAAFVQAVSRWGIRKLRITGGEPLMRPGLSQLIAYLNQIEGIDDIALTTNGMLLADQVDALVSAGLKRVNISLDTLNDQTFRRLSRRDGLGKVLEGIEAATSRPELSVKLNALVMRDINLPEVLELVGFARQRRLELRFIEFMPLDAERAWNRTQMVSGQELRALIETAYGSLRVRPSRDASQPAHDYEFDDGTVLGFIDSVTAPFCSACDRLRLTADGKLRNCLFGQQEWDIRPLLAQRQSADNRCLGAGDLQTEFELRLETLVRQCLAAKKAAHGIDAEDFRPPERAMFQIGG